MTITGGRVILRKTPVWHMLMTLSFSIFLYVPYELAAAAYFVFRSALSSDGRTREVRS